MSIAATFQPDCSPPMTVAFTDITVTDNTNGLSVVPWSPTHRETYPPSALGAPALDDQGTSFMRTSGSFHNKPETLDVLVETVELC